MSTVRLDAIRECFEGLVPAVIATADAEGMPNVSYLTQAQYVDPQHIALSWQFFNKTRSNILLNRKARLVLISPLTAAQYQLTIEYLRTETSGALFENMKAKLMGIASHVGMAGVFQLLGSDVYRVTDMQCLSGPQLPAPLATLNRLAELRTSAERLRECRDLERLLDETLRCLDEKFAIPHAMILMHDEGSGTLYTVASHGYAESGVGSEIALGEGVIGVAARERTPIRITHMASEVGYGRAMREQLEASAPQDTLALAIPLPGLPDSRSQLAVPILGCDRLLGVLYVESAETLRFTYDDEDALVALGAQLAMAMHIMQGQEAETAQPVADAVPALQGAPLVVRHYAGNDSVFFGEDYLIKGVAGRVLWGLLQDYVEHGRNSFSNRELRVDPRLRLPDLNDNLEARLVLLARRLAERDAGVAFEKTGRGQFRLLVQRPLQLVEAG